MSLTNILQREEIMASAPERYMVEGLFDFCNFTDRAKVSKQTKYQHMEEDALRQICVVESVAGSDAEDAVATVTLEEASHANSGKLSPVLEGQEIAIYTSTGLIYTRIRSVNKGTDNAHTFTCQQDGVNIVGALAIGDIISILSDSRADGSDQPGSEASLPLEFFNYTQIMKSQHKSDGSERANVQELIVDGQPRYVIKQEKRLKQNHDLKVDFAMLLGQRLIEPDANGKSVYKTGGLDWFARTNGTAETWDGSLTKAELVDFERTLTNEQVKGEVFFLAGSELGFEVNGVLQTLQQNTGINYAAFGEGSDKKRAVDLGFDTFKLNDMTFHKKIVGALNQPGTTQFASSPFPSKGYLIPADKYVGQGGDSEFKMQARYKESDKENRKYKVWNRGQTITNMDQWELNMQTEIGFQGFCGNQYVAIDLA
jgi:hypothetical protein